MACPQRQPQELVPFILQKRLFHFFRGILTRASFVPNFDGGGGSFFECFNFLLFWLSIGIQLFAQYLETYGFPHSHSKLAKSADMTPKKRFGQKHYGYPKAQNFMLFSQFTRVHKNVLKKVISKTPCKKVHKNENTLNSHWFLSITLLEGFL